jgi:branched-chain amino acid transport system permease protein
MQIIDIFISGLLLSGTYALVAMGLNLQYGVARIMNLANGEVLVFGSLAAFWLYTSSQISPLLTILIVIPISFIGNLLIYKFLLAPLVRRSKSRGALEVDSILATFGMSFILIGIMISIEGGFFAYKYLSEPIQILGSTTSLSRLVAFLIATLIALVLYLWLNKTRSGVAVRAVSVSTEAAGLVGINVPRLSAFAFALGGAITAVGGALISTFITLDASIGVVFTLKALIIVIMGGVGEIRGAIIAAIILGIVETTVATLVDPGLTLAAAYFIFVLILLFRPQGLFGRRNT